MKKLLTIIVLMVCSISVCAQQDVTKFLGIPIDGYKKDMIRKLEQKGYVYNAQTETLSGEFNGTDVLIVIGTNNNKVYRLMVCDAYSTDEADIKIRFNNLCHQFERNPRYTPGDYFQDINEDEDISYQINVKHKRFEADFYQTPKGEEINYNKYVWFMICELDGKYYISIYYDNVYNQANGDDL